MIDNWISDPMKKSGLIWSYILKVMNFLILGIFFQIFLNLFSIFKWLKNKKMAKTGLYFARDPRGCDVARKATWQSHADPRERLRGANVTHVHIFIYS